jgi:hypothetical protein
MDACDPPSFEGGAFADTLVMVLTGLYAKSQSAAARKVGARARACVCDVDGRARRCDCVAWFGTSGLTVG